MSRSSIRCCSACRRISRRCRRRPRRPATRATTISMRRRPRPPISRARWSRNSGGTSRPARNCRPSLTGADDVKVKLRVLMTPDGKLAAEPILIEASASMKGPLLMQGAIRALQACQPYAMLPADRYGEWKVLDLSFTPQDFSGPDFLMHILLSVVRRGTPCERILSALSETAPVIRPWTEVARRRGLLGPLDRERNIAMNVTQHLSFERHGSRDRLPPRSSPSSVDSISALPAARAAPRAASRSPPSPWATSTTWRSRHVP